LRSNKGSGLKFKAMLKLKLKKGHFPIRIKNVKVTGELVYNPGCLALTRQ
jgi:hypothetical protein